MSRTYVNPYQSGTAYTDAGSEGNWQTEIEAPVTGAADTLTENIYGQVDGQGRPAFAYVSAARTATPTSYSLYTRGASGIAVTIVVTAVTSTPSVVFSVQAYDAPSATWVTLLSSAAIATVSTTRLVIALGATVTANVSVSTILPDTIRIVPTHGNANSITYSVGLDWM